MHDPSQKQPVTSLEQSLAELVPARRLSAETLCYEAGRRFGRREANAWRGMAAGLSLACLALTVRFIPASLSQPADPVKAESAPLLAGEQDALKSALETLTQTQRHWIESKQTTLADSPPKVTIDRLNPQSYLTLRNTVLVAGLGSWQEPTPMLGESTLKKERERSDPFDLPERNLRSGRLYSL